MQWLHTVPATSPARWQRAVAGKRALPRLLETGRRESAIWKRGEASRLHADNLPSHVMCASVKSGQHGSGFTGDAAGRRAVRTGQPGVAEKRQPVVAST